MQHIKQPPNRMSENTQSYQPYSNKPGECIVKGSKGGSYLGLRIESISFPLTISALQAGICLCLMNGEEPKEILISDSKIGGIENWKSHFDLHIQIVEKVHLKHLIEEVVTDQQSLSLDLTRDSIFSPISHDEFELSHMIPKLEKAYKQRNQNLPIFTKKQMDKVAAKLRQLCSYSICEESNFPVSAMIWTEQGLVPGVNVEFKDWENGLCAERTALASALRYSPKNIYGLFVHAEQGDLSTPCGACRQVLNEHMPYAKLYSLHKDGSWSEYSIHELLPHAFSSNVLSKTIE
jgi:homotetrameric cytidine deaminase